MSTGFVEASLPPGYALYRELTKRDKPLCMRGNTLWRVDAPGGLWKTEASHTEDEIGEVLVSGISVHTPVGLHFEAVAHDEFELVGAKGRITTPDLPTGSDESGRLSLYAWVANGEEKIGLYPTAFAGSLAALTGPKLLNSPWREGDLGDWGCPPEPVGGFGSLETRPDGIPGSTSFVRSLWEMVLDC